MNTEEVIGQRGANDNHNISNERCLDDDDDLGGIENDFNIPSTAQTNEPFFTQNGGEFNNSQHSHIPHDMELMPQDELANMSHFDGGNLIQAPMQVNSLNIEYAKTSKNIDVRRLKQVIWGLLCNSDDNTNDKVNVTVRFLVNIFHKLANLLDKK